ncbi:TIGR03086 family protein [Streptomyces sp. HC44]|uniref:TIGR03086 family protein n=1 Tax=Streptomyces scabichelini TaxID=2711217 RepID=A0A6G4VJY5_9ACTN|nr:TIGR03086 family metal-binding protein [Streptomyces scabichelini]NGO14478.1 TIGR03086 family protein [Streptomyces scabichelini]
MTNTGLDIVELDRIAVRESLRVLDAAGEEDWARPAPCTGWDLRRLLAHMAAQHHGFAAAARGAGAEAAYWREPEDMSEPLRTYRDAATAVLDAFAQPGVGEREFALPELGLVLPGRIAVRFHFLDYVVHAWDVAASLGVDLRLPDEVLAAGLAVARRVPADPATRGPGSAFAPALDVPEGADPLDETLRLLGRSPDEWPVGRTARQDLPAVADRPEPQMLL